MVSSEAARPSFKQMLPEEAWLWVCFRDDFVDFDPIKTSATYCFSKNEKSMVSQRIRGNLGER